MGEERERENGGRVKKTCTDGQKEQRLDDEIAGERNNIHEI